MYRNEKGRRYKYKNRYIENQESRSHHHLNHRKLIIVTLHRWTPRSKLDKVIERVANLLELSLHLR